jgi:hypothetical protein
MKSSSFSTSTFSLTGPSGAVAGTVGYDGPSKTATFTPSAPLAPGASYTATVSGSVQAGDGVAMGTPVTWSFTTSSAFQVIATNPPSGAANVDMSLNPTIQVSKPVDGTTLASATVKLLRSDSTQVTATLAWNAGTQTITVDPTIPLDYGMTYTLQVTTGLKASDGTTLAAAYNSTFTSSTTGSPINVDIGSSSPYHSSATGADWLADVGFSGGTARTVTNTITGTNDPALYQSERSGVFSYNIPVPNGVYDVKLHVVELTYSQTGTRVFNLDILNTAAANDVASLDIFSRVGANPPYVVTIPSVAVSSGRLLRLRTTAITDQPELAGVEIIPHAPTVGTVTPAAGATGVATTTAVSATFSITMTAATVNGSTVTLTGPGGASVPATVSYNASTLTATLTPSSALAAHTTYTVRCDTGIRDFWGLQLAAPYTWSFTTA